MSKINIYQGNIFKCLKRCAKWRLNAPFWTPESPECNDPDYRQWLEAGNSESHANLELFVAIAGEVNYGYDGQVRDCRPGDVFLVDRKIQHAREFPKFTAPFQHIWFWITPQALFSYVVSDVRNKLRPTRFNCEDQVFCSWLFAALAILRREQVPLELKRQHLTGIVYNLLNWHLLAMNIETQRGIFAVSTLSESRTDRERTVIAKTCDFIQQHSGCGISVNKLATLAGFSEFHFARRFKAYTGMTIHAYVDKARLNYAAAMEHNGYRPKELAEMLGFSSDATYRRWRDKCLPKPNI